ncbi:MAG TPA: MFS transporter [Lentisphaeria bacterium]|nr:MAG: hypothetical protein A2X47_12740 [Lentisphaerae bacterium GWF2_38_69]HBM16930.1 MFS transporter [Lentisphaeria bacterium]
MLQDQTTSVPPEQFPASPTETTKLHSPGYVINHSELTPKIWGLWLITGAGFALDGFDLFVIGIAFPLLMRYFPELIGNPMLLGLLGAAAPIGAVVGASVFGRLTDTLGRKIISVMNMVFFIIFATLSALSWSVWSLIIFRFMAGIGMGGEYPVNSAYIAEIIPKKHRKKMQVGNFSFQAIGAVSGALVGYIILNAIPEMWTWRLMIGCQAVFSLVLFFFRLRMPESSKWLASQGRKDKAAATLTIITGDKREIKEPHKKKSKFTDIFSQEYLKVTILSSIPWFLMDIAFYGIGIFTPIIITHLFKHVPMDNIIERDIFSIKSTMLVESFLLVGILLAILLIKRVGMMNLQVKGFWGMGIGMLILMLTQFVPNQLLFNVLAFCGFILFYLCLNAGPNPMSFLIPARIFPTKIRATGHGFSAAFAKAGATLGILFFPWMQLKFGVTFTVFLMAMVCFAGAIITQVFVKLIIRDKRAVKLFEKAIQDKTKSKHAKTV